jgi:hypothetical protein
VRFAPPIARRQAARAKRAVAEAERAAPTRPHAGPWLPSAAAIPPTPGYFAPRFGIWTQALATAPMTRPGDDAERMAEHAADQPVASQPGAGPPPSIGTPPWGEGRALSPEERHWHEPRLGVYLRDVRIHEGAEPSRWARFLGAHAFTIGRDIVLGEGAYSAATAPGRRLMAHELAHVAAGRGQPPLLARVALAAADFEALADALHAAIADPKSDEELIYVALQKLERDPAAIASLAAAYRKKYTTALTADLAARLKGRSLALANTLLGVKGGLGLAAAPPAKPAEFETVARAINAALTAKAVDAEGVYAALLPLLRDPGRAASLKTTYATLFKTGLEADLSSKLAGADLAYALYLLNAPGLAAAHAPTLFKAQPGPGRPPKTAPPAVAGGAVTAATEVPWETKAGKKGQYGFGVGYSGALASDSRWLQFIEREIDYVPKGGGKPSPLDREVTSGGGKNKYKLTTAAASPNWVVDSYDPSNPFFDETHSTDAWRDATSVSIYDAPAAFDHIVKELFDNGATTVTSRAHFETYLIRDFSAIYRVEIEIVWSYSAPGRRTTNRDIKATGAVTALPGPLKAALTARYPAFAYIR